MRYQNSLFIFLLSLLLVGKVSATQIISEVMLADKNNHMLTQVSGLARFKQWIFVLGQDKNKLYYLAANELATVFSKQSERVRLNELVIEGQLPQASWEAISFGTVAGKSYVFLSHEHDFDGDKHQVFYAEVTVNKEQLAVGELQKLGVSLPLLSNENVQERRRYNYGYEAIAWHSDSEKLMVIPELKTQEKFAIGLDGKRENLSTANHNLRASDMTFVGEQCLLVTSNCFASPRFTDALCESGNAKPKLTIASFRANLSGIEMIDNLDVTAELLPVDVIKSAPAGTQSIFNMEGITRFQDGFLVVNDNIPRGYAKTVLRYIKLENFNSKKCTLNKS